MARTKKKLGDILVEANLISQSELQKALNISRESNAKLGKVLVDLGYVTEEKIVQFLGEQYGFPFMKLSNVIFDPEAINKIPKSLVTKHKAVPVFKNENKLTVAVADPLNIFAIDDFESHTGMDVSIVLATPVEIDESIDKYYGFQESAKEIFRDYTSTPDAKKEREDQADREISEIRRQSSETPVVKFVNLLLKDALDSRASDIHLESQESGILIRFRIDGVLFEKMKPPQEMQNTIIARLKILSGMDIGNSRIFQDGRFQMRVDERQVDFRVSVIPAIYGENVVVRILDKSQKSMDLESLGFKPEMVKLLRETAQSPQGLCLITGPTGSGKTSTLYAMLKMINARENKIITLEDPVEYRFPLISQIQIDEKSGVDFSGGLRAILRHDPDVILVGEMRDSDTANLAMSASMTGHLVLSTLHTNDAASCIQRLSGLGVKQELIQSTVKLIVAQRLIRNVCRNCATDQICDSETAKLLGVEKIKKAVGCPKCNQSGYLGRTVVYEYVLMEGELKNNLPVTEDPVKIREYLMKYGFKPMYENALDKVKSGLTTMEEVRKVIWEV